nr:MAG TPA: hypothetical protein [Caudoviricetes sp.]
MGRPYKRLTASTYKCPPGTSLIRKGQLRTTSHE